MKAFFDAAPSPTDAALTYRDMLAHHYNLMIPEGAKVLEVGCGGGDLLGRLKARQVTGVDISPVQIERARARVPHGTFFVQSGEQLEISGTFDVIILSDTLNYAADVQALLARLHTVSTPGTRLIVNFQSNLWRPLLALGRLVRLGEAAPESSWLAKSDVRNLLDLADLEEVRHEHRLLMPLRALGLEYLVNRWIAPLMPWLCLTDFIVARPRTRKASQAVRSVSVVIPARNEAGNIEAAVRRTPEMGAGTEIIFVEGNSTDDTWEEIRRVKDAYPQRRIRILQQTGKGKGNAVREGFAIATGDILMILDADLTMPPEELPKFYDVVASGCAEFANGVRLVYPMEERAMQFLNLCANKTFGLLFTWMLGQSLKDTLCGTKVLSRDHYNLIVANRAYFGDFDPFGDFDLLFGAGRLNLKIADVPIRYRERVYGATNIHRWTHGWLLLRMVWFAARKLKFV
jgi:SAM-dependent methyltransferase